MGQAIACCGNSDIDKNDIKTNIFDNSSQNSLPPRFAALKPSERLALIIKIQAVFRGFKARREVTQIRRAYHYMHSENGGGMMINPPMLPDGTVVANYDNPDVIAIRE